MQVTYKLANCELTVEGADAKAVFDEIASAIEVFGHSRCGACDSERTALVTRDYDGNTYREIKCQDCGSVLGLGQRKDGKLFPRRKDKDGNWLPNNGWAKWGNRNVEDEIDDPFLKGGKR
jgi:hypothetical protein